MEGARNPTSTSSRVGSEHGVASVPLRYERLVAGFDGSEHAADGLTLARMLAGVTGAELLAVAIVPHEFPYTPGSPEREDAMHAEALQMLAGTIPTDERTKTEAIRARSAPQGLHDLAESVHADALVVGSSHRGPVGRVLAGSVAERILYGAPCPVAVAPVGLRDRGTMQLRVVGCGFDGSDESWLAVRHAELFARRSGAALRLLAVHEREVLFGMDGVPVGYDPAEISRDARTRLEEKLEEAAASVAPGVEVQRYVLEGSALEALVSAAENGIDLLVVGSRQYGPVRRVLLGGVSSGLVRASPSSVLVVPRPGT